MVEKEILGKARELLAPDGAWCQGHSALDSEGIACGYESRWAVRRCLIGAVETVAARNGVPGEITSSAFDIVLRTIDDPDHMSIVSWNDATGRTQDQVLALIDAAISRGEESE